MRLKRTLHDVTSVKLDDLRYVPERSSAQSLPKTSALTPSAKAQVYCIASGINVQTVSNILRQADWIVKNREVIEYFVDRESWIVNRNNDQRLTIHDLRIWCLAGKILPEAESLLNYLDKNIQLEVFTSNCLVLLGERWLVVQPYSYLVNRESYLVGGLRDTNNEIRDTLRQSSGQTRYDLTKEEINDFFSENDKAPSGYDADEDEITEITYEDPYFV